MRLFLVLCLLYSSLVAAQDRHFTQFYGSPLTLNPALTGAFDGTYRVGAIYRDQWRSLLGRPYTTFSLGSDFRFGIPGQRTNDADKIGVGLLFYRDQVGQSNFNSTQIAVSGAFHKSLNFNNSQFLSAGFQVGLTQRSVNYEFLTFQDQYDGSGAYNGGTAETLPNNIIGFGDISAGVNYTYAEKGSPSLFVGAAVHHLNQPNISFYERDTVIANKLPMRYSMQVSSQLPLNRNLTLLPRLLFALQGQSAEINAGTNLRIVIDDINNNALHIGSWVRPVKENKGFGLDALVGLVGLEFNNILAGLSYDFNLPSTRTYKRAQNTFEFSIIYLGNYQNDEILCPSF